MYVFIRPRAIFDEYLNDAMEIIYKNGLNVDYFCCTKSVLNHLLDEGHAIKKGNKYFIKDKKQKLYKIKIYGRNSKKY